MLTNKSEVAREMKSRNKAMLSLLLLIAALFYGVAVVRFGDALKKGASISRFAAPPPPSPSFPQE